MHEQAQSRRNSQLHTLAATDYSSPLTHESGEEVECTDCGLTLMLELPAQRDRARCPGCVAADELGIGLSGRAGLPSELPRGRRAAKDPFRG